MEKTYILTTDVNDRKQISRCHRFTRAAVERIHGAEAFEKGIAQVGITKLFILENNQKNIKYVDVVNDQLKVINRNPRWKK